MFIVVFKLLYNLKMVYTDVPRPNVGYSYHLSVPTKLCCVPLTIFISNGVL